MSDLLDYYNLWENERKPWRGRRPMTVLAAEDPRAATRLRALVKGLTPFSESQEADLVNVAATDADRAAARLCRAYRQGTDLERAAIRSVVTARQGCILLTFSRRAAVRGFQRKQGARIREALVAHAVEDLACGDVRDNLMTLGVVYHCAARVHRRPVELFDEAAGLAGPAIAAVLTEFARRDDLDIILWGIGYKEVRVRGKRGFREDDEDF